MAKHFRTLFHPSVPQSTFTVNISLIADNACTQTIVILSMNHTNQVDVHEDLFARRNGRTWLEAIPLSPQNEQNSAAYESIDKYTCE
jgi:hypothetical protein